MQVCTYILFSPYFFFIFNFPFPIKIQNFYLLFEIFFGFLNNHSKKKTTLIIQFHNVSNCIFYILAWLVLLTQRAQSHHSISFGKLYVSLLFQLLNGHCRWVAPITIVIGTNNKPTTPVAATIVRTLTAYSSYKFKNFLYIFFSLLFFLFFFIFITIA